MKVIINKTKNYTTVSNTIFKDSRLSFKAKGLFVTMWSCPPTWNFTIEGLCSLSTDGRSSIRSAIIELEQFGYLVRKTIKDDKGQFSGSEYILFEEPVSNSQKSDNTMLGKPISENRISDKRTQLNTIELNKLNNNEYSNNNIYINNNTDKLNTKELNNNGNVSPLKDRGQIDNAFPVGKACARVNNIYNYNKYINTDDTEDYCYLENNFPTDSECDCYRENNFQTDLELINENDVDNSVSSESHSVERKDYVVTEAELQREIEYYKEKIFPTDLNEINSKVMPHVEGYMGRFIKDDKELQKNAWELEFIFFRFYEKYFLHFRKRYDKIFRIEKYKHIAANYMNPPVNMKKDKVYDADTYEKMMDIYFKTEYNKQKHFNGTIDKTLAHFFNPNILNNLYKRVQTCTSM